MKMLKFTVAALGVLLLGGTILLASLVFQRNESIAADAPKPPAGPCPGGNMLVESKGKIDSASVSGNTITIVTTEPLVNGMKKGQSVLVIDYCTNKVISRIDVGEAPASVKPKN